MARNEVKLFKALADETRLSIVEFLEDSEKCVCKIIPMTGKSQPTVSQHLRILSEAGILESRKEGTNVYYKIRDRKVTDAIKILSKL
jgi:ArsR family transcriptional regulator